MSRPRPAWRPIDHTADMGFEVEAPDWPSLLTRATAALGDLVLADAGEPCGERRRVAVAGADREDVLVAWLTECVVLFDEEAFLVRTAEVEDAGPTSARGVLVGRTLDPGAEAPDRVVKAVTYHDLRVLAGEAGAPWRARVVLDL